MRIQDPLIRISNLMYQNHLSIDHGRLVIVTVAEVEDIAGGVGSSPPHAFACHDCSLLYVFFVVYDFVAVQRSPAPWCAVLLTMLKNRLDNPPPSQVVINIPTNGTVIFPTKPRCCCVRGKDTSYVDTDMVTTDLFGWLLVAAVSITIPAYVEIFRAISFSLFFSSPDTRLGFTKFFRSGTSFLQLNDFGSLTILCWTPSARLLPLLANFDTRLNVLIKYRAVLFYLLCRTNTCIKYTYLTHLTQEVNLLLRYHSLHYYFYPPSYTNQIIKNESRLPRPPGHVHDQRLHRRLSRRRIRRAMHRIQQTTLLQTNSEWRISCKRDMRIV